MFHKPVTGSLPQQLQCIGGEPRLILCSPQRVWLPAESHSHQIKRRKATRQAPTLPASKDIDQAVGTKSGYRHCRDGETWAKITCHARRWPSMQSPGPQTLSAWRAKTSISRPRPLSCFKKHENLIVQDRYVINWLVVTRACSIDKGHTLNSQEPRLAITVSDIISLGHTKKLWD